MKTTPYLDGVPPEFAEIFRQLVRRVQPAKPLEPETCRDYYAVLRAFPITVLAQSATRLAQANRFFPSTAEWYQAAQAVEQPNRTKCPKCNDYGLIRVNYHEDGGYDLAMCDCRAGQWYRQAGEAMVRKTDAGATAKDIGLLEEWVNEP
jgi:hypothetical protein